MEASHLMHHSSRFASAVRECFRDMLGVEIAGQTRDVEIRDFAPEFSAVAIIHFTGVVHGDFVLCLDETTAAKLIGAWQEGMPASDLRAVRPDFGGMLKELLNTAVGKVMPDLEEELGRLTYHPPMLVYGELDAPKMPSGNVLLETDAGPLSCCIVLDEAGSDAERMFKQAVDDLRRARHEVDSCAKVLEELLQQSRMGQLPRELLQEAERLLDELRADFATSRDSFPGG